MTTKTKRPVARPGDLAYVPNSGLGEIALYRIVKVVTGHDGEVLYYFLTDSANPRVEGAQIPAERVSAVFSNILNQE